MTQSWRKKKLTGLNGKFLRGTLNHENWKKSLAVQTLIHIEKTLPNIGKTGTNLHQGEKGRKMAHIMIKLKGLRRKGRSPSQKSTKGKRTRLRMSQMGTVSQKRVRSQSQKKKKWSQTIPSHYHQTHPQMKIQSWKWKRSVRKVRGNPDSHVEGTCFKPVFC